MFAKVKGFYQYNEEDCGAACLSTILYYFNRHTTISILRNKMSYDKNGASVLSIVEVAKDYGLDAEAYGGNYEELINQIQQNEFKFPMIVHIDKGHMGGHFIVIKKIKGDKIKVFDPSDGHLTLSVDKFISKWTGVVICFEQNETLSNNQELKKLFKNYYRYLRILITEKNLLILTIILFIIISLIAFAGAWIYKLVIDNYILKSPELINDSNLNNDFNFTLLILSLLVFYIFQSGLSFLNNNLIAKTSIRISNKLYKSFLQHLINIPEKDLSYFESGEILSRFQSIVQVQQSYLKVIFTLTTELIGAIIGGIILYNLSNQLFIYVILMILIYIIIFIIFFPHLKKNRKKYYAYYSESITALNQMIVGKSTILMHKSISWFLDKIFIKVKKSNRKLYNINILEGAVSSLVTMTESIGSLAILWKGSLLVINGEISLGSLVVFQSMMVSFILPIQQLILIQNEIQNLRILTQRLDDLYEMEVEQVSLPILKDEQIENYDIEFVNVAFYYYFEKYTLENINFQIKTGSKVGIVGNSGSGKTTLIKLMASLYLPTKGKVYLGGKPYESYSLNKLRENIEYVDQSPFILEGTILDNLMMGIQTSEENLKHVEKIADLCDLYHLHSSEINNLNMYLYENGNNLSGGQKQKIGLARALIKQPKLLLLDEATSNIDEKCKHKIFSYIYSLERLSVVSISHDKSIHDYSTHIMTIEQGGLKMIHEQMESNS